MMFRCFIRTWAKWTGTGRSCIAPILLKCEFSGTCVRRRKKVADSFLFNSLIKSFGFGVVMWRNMILPVSHVSCLENKCNLPPISTRSIPHSTAQGLTVSGHVSTCLFVCTERECENYSACHACLLWLPGVSMCAYMSVRLSTCLFVYMSTLGGYPAMPSCYLLHGQIGLTLHFSVRLTINSLYVRAWLSWRTVS